MSSSIKAIAAAAAAQAFTAAGDAIIDVVLRLGPHDDDYDAETDTTERSFAQISDARALPYDDEKESKESVQMEEAGVPVTRKTFLLLGASINTAAGLAGEIYVPSTGETWQIGKIETDPVNAVYIFHCTA